MGAGVEEGKIQFLFPRLIALVILNRDAEAFGHLFFGYAENAAQLTDTVGDLVNLELQICHLCHACFLLNMKTYKYNIILEKTESFLTGRCLGKNTLSEQSELSRRPNAACHAPPRAMSASNSIANFIRN